MLIREPSAAGASNTLRLPTADPTGSNTPASLTQSRAPTPDNFTSQRDDWFKAGKYFKVWAREGKDICDKSFVFLDVTTKDGQAAFVETLNEHEVDQSPSLSQTYVALKSAKASDTSETQEKRFESVRLERGQVPAGTFIELQHIYSIPFDLRYQELGWLKSSALKRLRLRYALNLIEDWAIGSEICSILDKSLKEDDD